MPKQVDYEAIAKALRAGVPRRTVMADFNVSKSAIQRALNPANYEAEKERDRIRHAARRKPDSRRIKGAKLDVPDSVIEERERRLRMPPQSITAWCFGDPAPGRSALDQPRAPETIVRRGVTLPRLRFMEAPPDARA
jgi:hypothetical protein